jgi:protease-4
LLTTFATTLFGISLMLNVYLLIFTGLLGGHGMKGGASSTVQEGDPKQVVAVVPVVTNLITDADAESFDKLLKDVEGNDNVKALVLRIDTPGGEVSPSDRMHQRILTFKAKRPGVPVVVSMGGLATSGGYFIACGADWLVAEPTTLTANIGVIEDSLNFSKLADKWGIEDTTLHNKGADFKGTGSMWREPTTEEIDYMRGLLDSMADQFHDVVKAGRQGKLKAPLDQVFNAQAYPAKKALDMGIIDQIGYLGDACNYAASQAKLTNMTVVKYEEPNLLQKLLGAKSELPTPAASGSSQGLQTGMLGTGGMGTGAGIKINGVSVDSPQLDRLLDPRPMYLWRPE